MAIIGKPANFLLFAEIQHYCRFFFISSGKNIYWHPNSNLKQHKMPIAGFCRCQNRLISPQTSVRSRRFWKKHVNRYFSLLTKKIFVFCSRPAAFAHSEEKSIRNHTQNPDPPGMLNNGGGGVPPGKRSLCGLGCTNLKSFHPKTGPRLPSSSSIAFVVPKMLFFWHGNVLFGGLLSDTEPWSRRCPTP